MSLLLNFLFSFYFVFASPYFSPNRDDLTVPEHCREMKMSFYQLPVEKMFIGRQGASAMGFSMEYPLARKNATVLWKYFRSLTQGKENQDILAFIKSHDELKRDYEIILRNYLDQDFEFSSEGDILEILAIQKLYEEFPSNHYYITGGMEYHEAQSTKTIGELDVFVGLKDTCEAVLVGEVKLGRGSMLHKARQQLQRFSHFLISHRAGGLAGEFKWPYGPNEPGQGKAGKGKGKN